MEKIFVIDDLELTTSLLQRILENEGYEVLTFSDAKSAIKKIEKNCPELVIMDIEMPKMNGLEALKIMKDIDSGLKVVMMTAYADMEKIQYFFENGALDFIAKPFSLDGIKNVISHVLKAETINDISNRDLLDKRLNFVGQSRAIKDCVDRALKVSNSNLPILLLGENGTGKEMFADFIHYNSIRKYNNIIKVNCAAIPRELAENEFFGHEKGAFTGANDTRPGKLELADKGTLFLDEIGDLDLNLQTKLLRAIEYKYFERIGGQRTIYSDFKLICATNKNLAQEVEKGRFREDLYYRINTITLNIPPLRERKEDIKPLVDHFIKKYGQEYMVVAKDISPEALVVLKNYDWSGNIRELKNAVQTMVTLTPNEVIGVENLPKYIYSEAIENNDLYENQSNLTLMEMEKRYITKVLNEKAGDKKQAAETLGISERTMYYKIKKHSIEI